MKTIIFLSVFLLTKTAICQVDSSSFLMNAFNHANKMKEALLSDDIKELYNFFKAENEELPSFEIFKEQTTELYHDENYEYESDLSNIILEKPLVFSYKGKMLQCVILRETYLKNSEETINTIMWYYSEDGKSLKWENFSSSMQFNTLQEQYPFVDLKLFEK